LRQAFAEELEMTADEIGRGDGYVEKATEIHDHRVSTREFMPCIDYRYLP
jgi:hypothetical protein